MPDDRELVAPCGMNCRYCEAYLLKMRGKTRNGYKGCVGCRPRNKQCAFIKKRCERLLNKEIDFCFECKTFPCEQLLKLDKRYQDRGWDCSVVENNKRIQQIGLDAFIEEQKQHFTCPKCGGDICIHSGECYDCGSPAR